MFTGSEPLFGQPESGMEIPPAISLPPGFHQILQSSEINDHVARFIGDAQRTTLIKIFSGYEGVTDAELLFSDAHCTSVAQHINRMSSQFTITDNSVAVPLLLLIEECLCHGLLAYRMMMLRSIPPDPFLCFDVGNRLKAALMRTELLVHWRGHFELLLWIAFMGAHTTTQGPLRDWYALLLRGINSHLGSKSWEQIKSILKKFLWIERCEILGCALWFEVESPAAHDSLPIRTYTSYSGHWQA
jgi:hypothetical protein